MTQPLDRNCNLPQIGALDREAGEFWVSNPFALQQKRHNLSAYERNRFYLNCPGQPFLNASYSSQADIDADSRAAIAADFNNDGKPDLLVSSAGGGVLRLFHNRFPQTTNYVRFDLVGTHSNRSAIGARLLARCGGRQIVRDLFPTNACQGMAPAEMLIGVGKAEQIDHLTVRWPSGKIQQFDNLPVNTTITLSEGNDDYQAALPEAAQQ
ncbi:MAG: CRTAC1 family protein [Pirellulales bacterium]